MPIKIKRRFKGWVAILVVIFALAAMFRVYGAPILQNLIKTLPSVGRINAVSDFLKSKGLSVPQQSSDAAQIGEDIPKPEGEENKVVPVIVHKAAKSDFEDLLPAMGTIKGSREIELRFEVNGLIEAINFRESDLIKKGDMVAVLNQQDAILKLEYSQSKLKTVQTQMLTAKKKLEIHQRLYQIGSIIKPKLEEIALEYENAKSQVTQAEKEVAFAKQEVQKAYLISPIDGILGTRDVEAGEFVTQATKIATIIDISSVWAELGIIEKDLQKISLGHEVSITVDAYPDAEFKGTIDNVLPIIEGKSRTITCRVNIDNQDSRLLPGMFAKGTIYVFGQKDVIVLPNTCLRDKDNDGTFDSVFVADEGSVAHQRDIEIGYLTTDNVVVASGVEEGELVVTEARAELQDGAQVEILETQGALGPMEQPFQGGGAEQELVIQ